LKIVTGKTGLILRLGMTAVVLLLGQQAMAVGTDAGTSIDNTVNVDYEVGGINQTDLTDTVSFVVDRRVDFTLTQLGGALVNVTPGEQNAFFDFLLTNTSNSPLDFSLALDDTIATVRGVSTTASMSGIEYAVNTLVYTGGEADPSQGGPQFVDELLEDDAIRIRVWGDAALTLLNGQVDGIEIEATAGEPGAGGSEGAPLTYGVVNGDLTIENVAANATGGGVEVQSDGFIVVTADLAVAKSYAVIAGSLGSDLAIPGATVEYTITVVNSSATDADDVVITDSIDTDVTLDLNVAAYGGEDIFVDNDGTQLTCNVENNADGDGCDLVGQDLTITDQSEVSITVAGNTTLTIQYRVTIPTP